MADIMADEGQSNPRLSLFKEYRDDLLTYLSHVRNEIQEVLQDDTYIIKIFANDGNDDEEANDADDSEEGNFVIEHTDTFRQGQLALYIENM